MALKKENAMGSCFLQKPRKTASLKKQDADSEALGLYRLKAGCFLSVLHLLRAPTRAPLPDCHLLLCIYLETEIPREQLKKGLQLG